MKNIEFLKEKKVQIIGSVLFIFALLVVMLFLTKEKNYIVEAVSINGKELTFVDNIALYENDQVFTNDSIQIDYKGYKKVEFDKGESYQYKTPDQIVIRLYKNNENYDQYVVNIIETFEDSKALKCPFETIGNIINQDKDSCSVEVTLKGKKYLVEARLNNNFNEGDEFDREVEIKIDDLIIFKEFKSNNPVIDKIDTINDAIFFVTHSGNDVNGTKIIGVVPGNKVFLDIEKPDTRLENMFIRTREWYGIYFENNKIVFNASRILNDKVLLNSGVPTDVCATNKEEIIAAKYTIDYYGNGKISSVKRSDELTINKMLEENKDMCK